VVLSIVAAVVCCVAGLFGIGGIVVLGEQAVEGQAKHAAEDFYRHLMDGKYVRAYTLLCDGEQSRRTVREFQQLVDDGPDIVSYEIGQLEVLVDRVSVPVELGVRGANPRQVRLRLAQDPATGEFRVCGPWV